MKLPPLYAAMQADTFSRRGLRAALSSALPRRSLVFSFQSAILFFLDMKILRRSASRVMLRSSELSPRIRCFTRRSKSLSVLSQVPECCFRQQHIAISFRTHLLTHILH